jgi:hypothetical protein
VASVWTSAAPPADLPAGALAFYHFGGITGGTIPNQISATGAPSGLTIRGSDFQLETERITWNRNIGSFTFSFPFDAGRGTFAETPTSFPNDFGAGGTLAVRLRLDSSVANLGQASSMGLITFRPDPDINIHRVTPRGLEIKRDGATDPLYFLVREGNNSIGYNNEFNDEVRSGPISNPTADRTVIVAWDAGSLRIFVDGALAGTESRVTVDHPTPRYRIMVAVQPGLIHSSDNQFFKGAISSFVLYNRVLSGPEIAMLNSALEGGGTIPGKVQNLRIVGN